MMELESKEAIPKEEFYREYSWSLRRSTPQEFYREYSCSRLHFGKCISRKHLCYGCGKVGHLIQNCNQAKRNGTGPPRRK